MQETGPNINNTISQRLVQRVEGVSVDLENQREVVVEATESEGMLELTVLVRTLKSSSTSPSARQRRLRKTEKTEEGEQAVEEA